MLYIRKIFNKFTTCENCHKKTEDNTYFMLVLKAKLDYLEKTETIDLVRLCRNCLKEFRDMITKELRKKKEEE